MSKYKYTKTNDEFYRSKEWKTLRLQALQRDNYLCQECLKRGVVTPASTVHHIEHLRVNRSKALDLKNLETVCTACHNKLHRERTQTLKKKNTNIKNQKSRNVLIFKANPERW